MLVFCRVRAAPAAVRRFATYANAEEHVKALQGVAQLPKGFRVGTQSLSFRPREVPDRVNKMNLTLIALDEPTSSFAGMFTSNAFPGAPVIVGRRLVASGEQLQAIVINNKISNVCAPGGVEDAQQVCAAVAKALKLKKAETVLPSSTGIIGWKLPVPDMVAAVPGAVAALQSDSILPAAYGIMTTDMYPKVRSASLPGTAGRIVGIAKGAGMIEPNLATMLVYVLTDYAIPKDALRASLPRAVNGTFNALSIDSDQSTSDTCVLVSSGKVPLPAERLPEFEKALTEVCAKLSEDIVRNGEGVQHVIRVAVHGASSTDLARAVGKSIVNSPLFKCAVAGNDPNVGRLVAAIGKCVGSIMGRDKDGYAVNISKQTSIRMGGVQIYSDGQFRLTPEVEKKLNAHMKEAQLWESRPAVAKGAKALGTKDGATVYGASDVLYQSPVNYPPHERMVEIEVNLGMGSASMTVLGSDLTHEYVSENADYRS